jgi:sulfide:quinone oxidoreductase
MGKQILILGAGFGGLEAASALRQNLNEDHHITLIDKNDSFFIGFSKFDVMFGRKSADEIKSYYKNIAVNDINFVQDNIELIDPENKIVKTQSSSFPYDILIIALGADLAPEAIPGFVTGGHEFYSLPGAQKLFPVLDNFKTGTILISIFSKPYKCPPAPYEAAFQLHDFFLRKGIRDSINIKMLIPGPIPLPIAKNVSIEIEKLLGDLDINLLKKHKVVELKPQEKMALIEGRKPLGYDLFMGIPVHKPPKVVGESVLGINGWIRVNRKNLETNFPDVYAVGDVTNIPVGDFAVPKAGAIAENAAAVVVNDILNKIYKQKNTVKFNAEGTCYIELGEGKVAKLNANILGNSEPLVTLDGPSFEYRSDKIKFERDRINKWFK